MKIESTIETITPAKAGEYLGRNPNNRNKKLSWVAALARNMRNGTFLLTHQGIAFNTKGELIDGQNRLEAIRLAGIPVKMMVTRNLPDEQRNGVILNVRGAIDGGCPRNVGDNLVMDHGVEPGFGNITAAIVRMIAWVCANYSGKVGTADSAKILAIYGKDIERVIMLSTCVYKIRNAPVMAALALGNAADKELIEEFIVPLFSGEELKLGNPILTLRDYLLRTDIHVRGGAARIHLSNLTLTALDKYFTGEKWGRAIVSDVSKSKILAKQSSRVKKVAELFPRVDLRKIRESIVK